jgi:DNA-binding CsgD family transcriptional regulator
MGHTHASSPEWMRSAARAFNASGTRDLSASRRVLEQTGRFRVHALSKGMVDLDAYRQSQIYDYYFRQQGIVDRIWIMFPVNDDSESCFCFDRFKDHPEFDDREIKMAAEALRGIKWFHRQLLLCRGLGVAKESITPAECGIVRELLTGASEKEIAARLNLTPASAHQYAVRIYRKFGVHGRSEFMALWLGTRS